MPALPGFHDHGPFSSLSKNGWVSAKVIAGGVRDKRRTKISISKLKSKGHFNANLRYIFSTNGSSAGGSLGAQAQVCAVSPPRWRSCNGEGEQQACRRSNTGNTGPKVARWASGC